MGKLCCPWPYLPPSPIPASVVITKVHLHHMLMDYSVAEAKKLRREITRIAADYDLEWKGDLEDIANNKGKDSGRGTSQSDGNALPSRKAQEGESGDRKMKQDDGKELDIDKTIDEASEMAEQSQEKRNKEKAAQRKGEVIDREDGEGKRKKSKEGDHKER